MSYNWNDVEWISDADREKMNTCNQCLRPMAEIMIGTVLSHVCDKPECPNYALIQLPMERMEKYDEDMQSSK